MNEGPKWYPVSINPRSVELARAYLISIPNVLQVFLPKDSKRKLPPGLKHILASYAFVLCDLGNTEISKLRVGPGLGRGIITDLDDPEMKDYIASIEN